MRSPLRNCGQYWPRLSPTMSSHNHFRAKGVQAMFQSIARRYDAFNTIATLGRDGAWRRQAAEWAVPSRVAHVLDVATGTGKLTLELAQRADRVTAFDFADRMVRLARQRLLEEEWPTAVVELLVGDAMTMPFRPDSFDSTTIAFGLRNVEDAVGCLREFLRVLKPGGRLVILEISRPSGGIPRLAYETVFKQLLPLVGWALSGDRSAYRYLPTSVDSFPSPPDLVSIMTSEGFTQVQYKVMHMGAITLHIGVKPG